MLIDGHLRAETTLRASVPVLVLDVNEEEADKILATAHPLAAMAETASSNSRPCSKRLEPITPPSTSSCVRPSASAIGNYFIRTKSAKPRSLPTGPTSFARNGIPGPARSGSPARIGLFVEIAPTSRRLPGFGLAAPSGA